MIFRPKTKKLGLALSSGGSRGLAHIGVIKALCDNNIPISCITGSSVGSLIGGFYACNPNIDRLLGQAQNLQYRQLLNLFFEPLSPQSLVRGQKILKYIDDIVEGCRIEDVKIPFSCVATDLLSGEAHVFLHGSLSQAIRASCSLPVIFSPVKIGRKVLIDGGTSVPVPVALARFLGADITLAVDLYASLFPQKSTGPTVTLDLLLHHLAKANTRLADLTISPVLPNISPLDFVSAKKLIDIGYRTTLKQVPEIKKLLGL